MPEAAVSKHLHIPMHSEVCLSQPWSRTVGDLLQIPQWFIKINAWVTPPSQHTHSSTLPKPYPLSYLFTDRSVCVCVAITGWANAARQRGSSVTVMDGTSSPLLPLTCWLGPMPYSWDLGQERDAERFKNILRNSLGCQPSCQVVLSKESEAIQGCGRKQKGQFFSLPCFMWLRTSREQNRLLTGVVFAHLNLSFSLMQSQ